jgi:hypothetical protein
MVKKRKTMAELSYFESRTGKSDFSSGAVYAFVTDVRNFERFIPEGTVSNWKAEKESCTFTVPILGTVGVRLIDKEINKRVGFEGDAMKKNDFSLVLTIIETGVDSCEVKVSLKADINPMLKLMAAKPIAMFLNKLIDEMEKFRDWRNVRE